MPLMTVVYLCKSKNKVRLSFVYMLYTANSPHPASFKINTDQHSIVLLQSAVKYLQIEIYYVFVINKGSIIAGVPNKLAPYWVHTHTLPALGRDVPRSIVVCEAMWY